MQRRDFILALAFVNFVSCKNLSGSDAKAKMAADSHKKITQDDVMRVIEARLAEKNPDYAAILESRPDILERQPDIAQSIRTLLKSNPKFFSDLEKWRLEGLKRLGRIDMDPSVKMIMLDLHLEKVMHEVATTLDHFIGVFEILREWGHSDEEAYTGLFHAVYGTEFNPVQVLNHKRRQDRDLLTARVGQRSERLIYLYATMNSDVFLKDVSEQKKAPQSVAHFQTKEAIPLDQRDFVILADSQIANSYEPYIALNKDLSMLNRVKRFEPLRQFLSTGGQKVLDLAKV